MTEDTPVEGHRLEVGGKDWKQHPQTSIDLPAIALAQARRAGAILKPNAAEGDRAPVKSFFEGLSTTAFKRVNKHGAEGVAIDSPISTALIRRLCNYL